jgi:hypothetical protein
MNAWGGSGKFGPALCRIIFTAYVSSDYEDVFAFEEIKKSFFTSIWLMFLTSPILADRHNQAGGTLSGGEFSLRITSTSRACGQVSNSVAFLHARASFFTNIPIFRNFRIHSFLLKYQYDKWTNSDTFSLIKI